MATSAEVCQRSGASFRQLDHWVRQHYLRPVGDAAGSGYARDFSYAEVLIACRMVKMIGQGFTVEAAARYAREGAGWLRVDDSTISEQTELLTPFVVEFDWSNYGLDGVELAEHHDWATALAQRLLYKLGSAA